MVTQSLFTASRPLAAGRSCLACGSAGIYHTAAVSPAAQLNTETQIPLLPTPHSLPLSTVHLHFFFFFFFLVPFLFFFPLLSRADGFMQSIWQQERLCYETR